MRQMRKKMVIAIILTLVLTALIAFAIGYMIVNSKNHKITALEKEKADITCLAFADNLGANSIITASDIKEIDYKQISLAGGSYYYEPKLDKNGKQIEINGVKQRTLYHYYTYIDENGDYQEAKEPASIGDLLDRRVKATVYENTPILDAILYPEEGAPTKDLRLQEFNFIKLPSDLEADDYIDIRIRFKDGEEYSVLIGKRIEKVAGENTIFITLDEEEIMAMGSAIIEAYMQDGTLLYANKYVDPATQLYKETQVDYVKKYDYAVKKLLEEKQELAIRKAVANIVTNGNPSEGTFPYTLNATSASGEEAETSNNSVNVTIISVAEDEFAVSKEEFALLPDELKERAKSEAKELEEADLTEEDIAILAEYAGIEEAYTEEIMLAKQDNDETILGQYREKNVTMRQAIKRTYPVREEVLAVIRNNPNLLETIKEEFNQTALLNTKVDEYKVLKAQYDAAYDDYTKDAIKQKMDAIVDARTKNVEEEIKKDIEAQRQERISYLEELLGE